MKIENAYIPEAVALIEKSNANKTNRKFIDWLKKTKHLNFYKTIFCALNTSIIL